LLGAGIIGHHETLHPIAGSWQQPRDASLHVDLRLCSIQLVLAVCDTHPSRETGDPAIGHLNGSIARGGVGHGAYGNITKRFNLLQLA
jgi:hypothetical protein